MWQCIYRSRKPIERRECQACGLRNTMVNIFTCELKGKCTIHSSGIRVDGHATPLVAVCVGCEDRQS